ncbi:MAG: hypothetical protein EPO41_00795 [Reyranella sp.]|uniref:hypothetical protein n=1 Tax=Reyranella sp. TaxID=1929291 RepID=UPI00120E0F9B|nr:hypothetical protein [Reyranella sp.]TAJ98032.1 MAG: hypothetical protein EPO41_00795 [Reyranella sp.]
MTMKPGEPISLRELVDPKPTSRAEMVALVPPPAMKEVDAPQLEDHAIEVQGFPGRTLDGTGIMEPASANARLPRWVRVTMFVFSAVNVLLLIYWLFIQFAPTR